MKYTLPKSYANAGLQVNIPEDVLKQYRKDLGSTKAAVDKWLFENGHMAKGEYEAMTETAAASRKPAKREFKVDQEKSEIIDFLYDRLREYEDEDGAPILSNIEIPNRNRLISFSLGNNKYEVTLVRKKK
jgi:hypothetical protein